MKITDMDIFFSKKLFKLVSRDRDIINSDVIFCHTGNQGFRWLISTVSVAFPSGVMWIIIVMWRILYSVRQSVDTQPYHACIIYTERLHRVQ